MTRSWKAAACAVGLVAVPAIVAAQLRPLPAMQTGVTQAQLQQALAQQKADFEQQLTAARFRITALEANQKQGGTTGQLQKQIDTLSFRATALEGYRKSDSAAIGTLTQRFNGHTHTYDRTTFGWNSAGGHFNITDAKIAKATSTSPPN